MSDHTISQTWIGRRRKQRNTLGRLLSTTAEEIRFRFGGCGVGEPERASSLTNILYFEPKGSRNAHAPSFLLPLLQTVKSVSVMPAIRLHPPNKDRNADIGEPNHSLPQLLQTPSGLAILEIQGTVNTPPTLSIASSSIGKLIFPQYDVNKPTDDTSWQKRVYLYVGKHQRMTGEVKKLAKPIAVIRRRQVDTKAEDSSTSEDGELEIAEIVYYKILFAHRPEPVGGD